MWGRYLKLFLFSIMLIVFFQNCGGKYSTGNIDLASISDNSDVQLQGSDNQTDEEAGVATSIAPALPAPIEDLAKMRVSGFYGAPGSPTAYGVVVNDLGQVFSFEERSTLEPPPRVLLATLSEEKLKIFRQRVNAAILESTTEASLGLPCMMDGGVTYFSVLPNSKSIKTLATEGGCEKTIILPGANGQELVRQLKGLSQLRF